MNIIQTKWYVLQLVRLFLTSQLILSWTTIRLAIRRYLQCPTSASLALTRCRLPSLPTQAGSSPPSEGIDLLRLLPALLNIYFCSLSLPVSLFHSGVDGSSRFLLSTASLPCFATLSRSVTVRDRLRAEYGGWTRNMKRRKGGFQEVALSLTEPGHMLLAGESTPPQPSSIDRSRSASSPRSKYPTQATLPFRPRVATCIDLDRSSLSGSTSTMRDLDSESLEMETVPMDLLSAISTPAQIYLVSAASKNKRIVTRSAATVDLRLGRELTFVDRVEGWERALRSAMELDSNGDVQAAIAAYSKSVLISRLPSRLMASQY